MNAALKALRFLGWLCFVKQPARRAAEANDARAEAA
jgi:hypothetical protein